MSDRPTRVEQTGAKQGKTGLGVRYVLIGGLVLIIVAGVIIWFTVR